MRLPLAGDHGLELPEAQGDQYLSTSVISLGHTEYHGTQVRTGPGGNLGFKQWGLERLSEQRCYNTRTSFKWYIPNI